MGNKVCRVHIRQNIPSLPTHGAVLSLTGPVLFLRCASAFTKVFASVFLCMPTLSCEYLFIYFLSVFVFLSLKLGYQQHRRSRGKKAAGERRRQGKEGSRGKKRQENSNHLEDVPAAALVPTYFRTINRWGRTAC